MLSYKQGGVKVVFSVPRVLPILPFLLASCSENPLATYANESGQTASQLANETTSEVSEEASESEGKVTAASISFDDEDCTAKGLPVAILLTNNTNTPTRKVSWDFAAFKENYSTDQAGGDWMLSTGDPNRATDRIIQPGETFKVCSSMPHLQGDYAPNELSYHVNVKAEF